MLTGSYHNYFRIFDVDSLNDIVLQADKSAFKQKKIGGPLPGNKLGAKNGTRGLRDAMQMEPLDFSKKILHASWHPRESTIAVRLILCLWAADIYYTLDCCNEQLVLIQRSVRFLDELRAVLVCVFSVFQYIIRSLFFPPLTLSTPPLPSPIYPSSRSHFSLTPYSNDTHTPHLNSVHFEILPLRSPSHTSPSPSPSSPTPVRISQCSAFRLTRERRIIIISYSFLELFGLWGPTS